MDDFGDEIVTAVRRGPGIDAHFAVRGQHGTVTPGDNVACEVINVSTLTRLRDCSGLRILARVVSWVEQAHWCEIRGHSRQITHQAEIERIGLNDCYALIVGAQPLRLSALSAV